MSIKFTIPIEPRTKKNGSRIQKNKKTGRRFVAPSKQFSEYQDSCDKYMPKVTRPIACKINIKAVYYMRTRRRVDITNLHSALHDILVHYGVIEDDNMNIVIATDGSRVRYDKQNPRTEVEITRMNEVTGFEN
ncbi:MAG: RusA family crossover junction endodeoxyribonuclease [Clostridiales bacterium]|nr:RusA family crossover junction endodeoxyribonuclease [Clostridiales bacterium]